MRTQKEIARKRAVRLKRSLQNTIEGSVAHFNNNPHLDLKTTVKSDVNRLMRRFARQEARTPKFYNDLQRLTEPPVNGLDYFTDDTGNYFWNPEKGSYEHYADPNGSGATSFQGYYSADEFSEPVGDYSIIFNLSGAEPDDKYDLSNTIWSVAAPLLAYLEKLSAVTFSEVKDISNEEDYPGVKIYSSEHMNGAITLGNLIITNPEMEDKDILDHEYGHYLDFKHHFRYNKERYLKEIGWPSLKSAAGSGSHDRSISEKRANRLGGEWGDNERLKNLFRNEK